MPTLRPVTVFAAVFAATGPWQVVCGPVVALYHHCAVCPVIVSVAVVAVGVPALRLALVVNAAAVASRFALAQPVAL